jgi:spore maturation protein CgeB
LLPANGAGNHHDLTLPPDVCGAPLSDAEMILAYSRSKISLGFSSVGETHLDGERITQVRLRDFEAPMCGSFYMVEYMPELEEFFEVGKEIVCYTDPDDLADKCRYYLEHDADRERIRLAGHKRAIKDHSWQKRFETVFQQIGLTQ